MHIHGSKGPCMQCIDRAATAARNMQLPDHAFHPGQTCLPNQSQTAKERPIPCQPAQILPSGPLNLAGRWPQTWIRRVHGAYTVTNQAWYSQWLPHGVHPLHSNPPQHNTRPDKLPRQHACTAVGKHPNNLSNATAQQSTNTQIEYRIN